MAEALLNRLYPESFAAFSAGSEPSGLHPLAVRVMAEAGIDISAQHSKFVSEFSGRHFDYAVTLCESASEACPFFSGADVHLHRAFTDPAAVEGAEEERLEAFRRVRDALRDWIAEEFGRRT